MKITALLVPDEIASRRDKDDIVVTFGRTVKAAIGVAVDRIIRKARTGSASLELKDAIEILEKQKQLELLKVCDTRDLISGDKKPVSYNDLRQVVDNSFACVVDLAGELPLSYFWLGYCHAREINVIPVYRPLPADEEEGVHKKGAKGKENDKRAEPENPEGEKHAGKKGREHVLAFDIRALWYMEHNVKKPRSLAARFASVIEELITKDVPVQQRRIFWERLTRKGRVHIITAAVHLRELAREAVGDWDLRAVSELVRYLSSSEESVVPEFEEPIYAPETIAAKLENPPEQAALSGQDRAALVRSYVELVKEEIKDRSCVIVASADVNPATEIVLAHVYHSPHDRKPPTCFAPVDPSQDVGCFVVLKGGSSADTGTLWLMRRFSRPGEKALEEHERGFLIDGNTVVKRPYFSQDQPPPGGGFSVLGHLMVVRNPFSNNGDDTVVILNGVSGPGTFGLAEVLTGGTSREKNKKSEEILGVINRVLDQTGSTGRGAEALIQVTIVPPGEGPSDQLQARQASTAPADTIEAKVRDRLYDKRTVSKWDLVSAGEAKMRPDNPREIR